MNDLQDRLWKTEDDQGTMTSSSSVLLSTPAFADLKDRFGSCASRKPEIRVLTFSSNDVDA